MMRGSPVCLPSGYSPILSGSCGRLLRVDELARRDMAARVGEGNGGAPATKDGETRDPGSRRKKKKCPPRASAATGNERGGTGENPGEKRVD